MMNLTLTNTLSGKKEPFSPQNKDNVLLYVCGITPYDYAHLGHGRCYVAFDVLARLLKFLGYNLSYVRNYTDIDDKLLSKAAENSTTYLELANNFIKAYQENMSQLNCLEPDAEPRVTNHIQEIIDFIAGLIDKKKAYKLNGDIYYDISTLPSYGKLSKRKLDDLLMGSRVEVNAEKKNPGDFALWKGNSENLFWESPWGYGRPGWHIECSAMAKKHLGETIDIHGGGADLIFPHHENEIAQSEGLHDKTFSRYWLHNAFININKEKMSKSLGNSVTLNDIFKKHEPIVLRYFFLQHHYRTPIDFSFEELEHVATAYKKLINAFEGASPVSADQLTSDLTKLLLGELCDDLNSTKMLGLVFQSLDTIKKSPDLKNLVYTIITSILGLPLKPLAEEKVDITPEIQDLLNQRENARKNKDWETADRIRDILIEKGIPLHDKKA